MNCDECQPLLIDLVCGELSADEARRVHAHADDCDRCGPDLRVLEEGMDASRSLPQLVPPAGVRDFVFAEARRQTEAAALRTDPPARPDGDDGQGGLGWFSRMAELAMSPQVAMVAVLLLMISVGLYYLPGPEREQVAVSPLRMQEEPEGSAEPSATATALPVDEEEAAREVEEEVAAEPSAPENEAKRAETRRRARLRAKTQERADAPKKRKARKRAQEPTARLFVPPPPEQPSPEPSAPAQAAPVDDALAERRAAPRERASAANANLAEDQAPLGGLARGASKGSSYGSGAASLEQSAGQSLLQRARAAQRAGRFPNAATLAEQALKRGASPAEAHAIAAEAHRRAGSCAKAAPHYVQWRQALGGKLPPAWPAAVRCFDALGKGRLTEVWLRAAEKVEPTRARQLRAALEREHDQRSAPASSEAESALEAQ